MKKKKRELGFPAWCAIVFVFNRFLVPEIFRAIAKQGVGFLKYKSKVKIYYHIIK